MYTLYNSYDSGKAYDYDGILLVISLWIGWLWFNQKVIVLVSFTELNELLKILGLPGVRHRKLRWPMLEVMWLRTRNVLEELQVVPVQQIPGGGWCSVCLNKQKEKKFCQKPIEVERGPTAPEGRVIQAIPWFQPYERPWARRSIQLCEDFWPKGLVKE